MGGWGLGLGGEDTGRRDDDDKDEDLNWDQAQVCTALAYYLTRY